MRDYNRIPLALARLKALWELTPDLRLGQLLVNAVGEDRMYYIEDEQLLEALEEFYAKHHTSM
jgi:hypothetical protein